MSRCANCDEPMACANCYAFQADLPDRLPSAWVEAARRDQDARLVEIVRQQRDLCEPSPMSLLICVLACAAVLLGALILLG